MTRTPDEIKKGLECCQDCQSCTKYDETQCPYYDVKGCVDTLLADAIALIQQLESDKQQLEGLCNHMNQLRDAAAGRALKMEERAHQLEAERDAAVKDLHDALKLSNEIDVCQFCNRRDCTHDGVCDIWEHERWEWRGVQKEEAK